MFSSYSHLQKEIKAGIVVYGFTVFPKDLVYFFVYERGKSRQHCGSNLDTDTYRTGGYSKKSDCGV